MTTLLSATPAMPVRDVPAAVAFYRERLGFGVVHQDGGHAIVRRDGFEITLWEANSPGTPGAEPHLAGSASCRVKVTGLRELYAELQAAGWFIRTGRSGAKTGGRGLRDARPRREPDRVLRADGRGLALTGTSSRVSPGAEPPG